MKYQLHRIDLGVEGRGQPVPVRFEGLGNRPRPIDQPVDVRIFPGPHFMGEQGLIAGRPEARVDGHQVRAGVQQLHQVLQTSSSLTIPILRELTARGGHCPAPGVEVFAYSQENLDPFHGGDSPGRWAITSVTLRSGQQGFFAVGDLLVLLVDPPRIPVGHPENSHHDQQGETAANAQSQFLFPTHGHRRTPFHQSSGSSPYSLILRHSVVRSMPSRRAALERFQPAPRRASRNMFCS